MNKLGICLRIINLQAVALNLLISVDLVLEKTLVIPVGYQGNCRGRASWPGYNSNNNRPWAIIAFILALTAVNLCVSKTSPSSCYVYLGYSHYVKK